MLCVVVVLYESGILPCCFYVILTSDENVVVLGDNVQLATAGTYTIRYLCKDKAGRNAVPKKRIVVVKNVISINKATSKADPVITIEGVCLDSCWAVLVVWLVWLFGGRYEI